MATRDMNRDPITGAPGSHPVGTTIGAGSGGAAGLLAGAPFGPIGMLIGGGVGAIVGAAAGHSVAESIDPTGEVEYWRAEYPNRPYYDKQRSFEADYRPAYLYGVTARNTYRDKQWNDELTSELRAGWQDSAGGSSLAWDEAEPAIRDAWDRTDRSYQVYGATDRDFDRYYAAAQRDTNASPDDYRAAYRYGTYAQATHPGREWDEVESELESDWNQVRGASKMTWNHAKDAAKRAWHAAERLLPGDADNDGR